METINREPLPKDGTYVLSFDNESEQNNVRIIELLSEEGGSCLVYAGRRTIYTDGNPGTQEVIVKEFYPKALGITRKDPENRDFELVIPEENQGAFTRFKESFGDGQGELIELRNKFDKDYILPGAFFYGKANGTSYSISEPSDGRVLKKIDFTKLSLNQIGSIMASVCHGLGYIHSEGKVLLDVKPDNLFFKQAEKDLVTRVYLFDLDTAEEVKNIKYGNNKKCSYSVGWSAPEQIPTRYGEYENPGVIGFHTDIYSVGMLFFWLLNDGMTPSEEDLRKIDNGIYTCEKYSSAASVDIQRIIKEILHNALEHDAWKRIKLFPNAKSISDLEQKFEDIFKKATDGNNPLGYSNKLGEDNRDNIEKNISLSEEILQTIKPKSKNTPNHIQGLSKKKVNRFQFNSESVDYYGIGSQLDYLSEMCIDNEDLFCWTAIYGIAGSGKSRLAYEVCKRVNGIGWDVFWVTNVSSFAKIWADKIYRNEKDTLICFDDAKSHIDDIVNFIRECRELNLSEKIRVILIDRDFNDCFIGSWDLFDDAYSSDKNYEWIADSGFILTEKLNEDDIKALCKDYCKNIYNKQLNDSISLDLFLLLSSIDTELRPLYALFICDAWSSGEAIVEWNINDFFKYVLNREIDRLSLVINSEFSKPSERSKALEAIQLFMILTLLLMDDSKTEILRFVQQFSNVDISGNSYQWVLESLSLIENDIPQKIYPDLMIEYIFVNFLKRQSTLRKQELFELLFDSEHFNFFMLMSCKENFRNEIDSQTIQLIEVTTGLFTLDIGKNISDGLSEEELNEFDTIKDPILARKWLLEHVPDFIEITKNSVNKTDRIRKYKNIIFYKCGFRSHEQSNNNKSHRFLEFSDGTVFEGSIENEEPCGNGYLLYDGEIIDVVFHKEQDGEWLVEYDDFHYLMYKGQLENGKPNGNGKMTFTDGVTYEGEWKDGKKHGHGKQTSVNGDVYEGEWKDDEENGFGKYTWANGDCYEGMWENSEPNGFGKDTWIDGEVYEGMYKNGKSNGYGKYTYANGDCYEGEWKDGEERGFGKKTFANGDTYEGEWKDGELLSGYNSLVYANGDCYEGMFENHLKNGHGKMTFANGDVYEGEWKDGKKHGHGEYTYANDCCIEGMWDNDKPNGTGKITYRNGDVYEGEWKDGKEHGFGKKTFANGDTYEGMWENGIGSGHGKYTGKNGFICEGEWKDGKQHGYGKQFFANGDCYEGMFENSLKNGPGKYTYANGDCYEGMWENNKTNGFGKETIKNGYVYEGEWKDGKQHGQGKYTGKNGYVYEGEWKDGKVYGFGKEVFENGDCYEGMFENVLRNGKGKLAFANGDVYEGEWKNGKKHGHGKYTSAEGSCYEGMWKNNKQNGTGKFANKTYVYEGEWKDGEEHGLGKKIWANGNTYEGELKDGLLNGHGKLTLANGDVYEGEWKDGRKHGQGKYTSAKGFSHEGMWENNEPNGFGKHIFPNGDVYEGEWKDGKEHGYGKKSFSGGDYYDGMFENSLRKGQGKYISAKGFIYEGMWENNEPNGIGKYTYKNDDFFIEVYKNGKIFSQGIIKQQSDDFLERISKEGELLSGFNSFVYPDGSTYEGMWENGARHGYGKMIYKDGNSYEGNWKNGVKHGHGKMIYISGSIFDGNWKNNTRNGQGKLIRKDKTEYECMWEDGHPEGVMNIILPNRQKCTSVWERGKPIRTGNIIFSAEDSIEDNTANVTSGFFSRIIRKICKK